MIIFLNQQFITQITQVDYGSYFVTTLDRTKEKKKKKKKKKRK